MATPPSKWTPPTLVNNIVRLLQLPCSTPPSLWVIFAVPSLVQAIWSYVSPGWKDIFRWSAGYGYQCQIKQGVTAAEQSTNSNIAKAKRAAFQAANYAEQANYWAMVFGVVVEGLIDWTSQVLKYTKCSSNVSPKVGSSNRPFGACFDGGNFGPSFDWDTAFGVYQPTFTATITVLPGRHWHMAMSATIVDGSLRQVPLSIRIVEDGSFTVLDEDTTTVDEHGRIANAVVFMDGHNTSGITKSYRIQACCPLDLPFPHEGFVQDGFCTIYDGR